jgi:hypothetical protein
MSPVPTPASPSDATSATREDPEPDVEYAASAGHVTNAPSSAKDKSSLGAEDLLANFASALFARLVAELGPYFSRLDSKTFVKRVVHSIVPRASSRDKPSPLLAQPDLYGPLVLCFSLSSALHFALQSPSKGQGYLGTALLVCFGTLVGGALALNVLLQYHVVRERQTHHDSTSSFSGLDRAVTVVGYSFSGPVLIVLMDGRLVNVLFVPAALALVLGSAACFGLSVLGATSNRRPLAGLLASIVYLLWFYSLRSLYRVVL